MEKKGRKTIRERQSERVRQIERTRDDGNDGGKKIAREMERNGQRERAREPQDDDIEIFLSISFLG